MADSNDRGGKRPGRPGGPPARDRASRPGPRGPGGPKPEGRFGSGKPARHEREPRREATVDRTLAPLPDLRGDAGPAAAPAEERIAKVIARAGLASRRDAEAMIAEGRVTLNGEALTSPAVNVGPDDRITIDGEALPSRERTRLWLFHKPRGLVTTFRDPEGRPTVFEALPEDMPRVVAIGRLDINTEGLLLLTNDGGLAKVIAHPETGWTRRYRVRAHGEVTQAELDKLRKGITVDGMEYGPIEATLDRVQGDNMWLTLALREGKNREVKRVLEHLGIQVNRLIRLSFGPFQLGDLEQGLVEEVRTRVLKDQLGEALAAEANVDFESPVREPIAPFGRPEKEAGQRTGRDRPPRARSAGDEDRYGARERGRPRDTRPDRPERAPAGKPREPRKTVWRADAQEDDEAPRKSHARREDPKADRAASAARTRERVGAIASPEGRRVLVERLVAESPGSHSGDGERPRRPRRDGADRPQRPVRGDRPERAARTGDRERSVGPNRAAAPGREREERRGPPRGRAPAGAPGAGRPARVGSEGRSGGFPSRGGPRPGGKPGGRPGGGPAGRPGGRPGGGPKGRPR